MATTPAQGTPGQNTTAAAVESPGAAPVVTPSSSSLPAAETAATDRAAKANSPADVRALLSDLRKAKPAPAVEVKPTPAPAEPQADPAESTTSATETEGGGEETPESKETEDTKKEGAAEENAETGDEDDDGGEGPISPITGNRTRLRLPESDQVGRLAASFMKRNRDLTMTEAVERAQKQLGVKSPAAAQESAETAPKSDLPTSVEAVDAELERVESERERALIDLRFEDVAKFDKSMRQLDRHRFTLEREGERNLAKQESDYNSAYSASETKAVDLYEFVGKPDSDGFKRMAEIDTALKENNDPLYASPDKPLRVAQMVAAELKIAPKRKGAPVTPAKAAAPVVTPAPKKQILPGGGSRTTPQTVNPTTAVADSVSKINSVHDVRKYLKSIGVK